MRDGYLGLGSGVESLCLNPQRRTEERSVECYFENEQSFRSRYYNRRHTKSVVRVTTHCHRVPPPSCSPSVPSCHRCSCHLARSHREPCLLRESFPSTMGMPIMLTLIPSVSVSPHRSNPNRDSHLVTDGTRLSLRSRTGSRLFIKLSQHLVVQLIYRPLFLVGVPSSLRKDQGVPF